MAIISQNAWDDMPKEEKEKIRKILKIMNVKLTVANDEEFELIERFCKENLQDEPVIKTWGDVEKEHPEHFSHSNAPNPMFIPSAELRDKLLKKTMATYKIATLIELGYGGMVTEEEWKDDNITKYCVHYTYRKGFAYFNDSTLKVFLAFHTFEQREEFMSYLENRKLVEQYYMF